MNELENLVKNVVYGGIGAAATIVEKSGDIARALVEKGQETIRANQDTVDQLKETAEDLGSRLNAFCERLMKDGVIDVSCLTREQRDAMRQQLDAQDELDRQAAESCTCETEAPAVEEPVPTIEVVEEPAPISDDAVPVFEPEQPTYTVPDEDA